jgi:poly-gamma-glutamate synthesis protein (capsule biosynthesis protein)
MVKAGADVVLCQHTHIIGCYEEFMGGHILYGQGNFHFSGHSDDDDDGWNQFLATVYDTKTHKIEFIPMVNCGPQIKLAEGAEKDDIIKGLSDRSASLKDGSWYDHWQTACREDFGWYVKAVGFQDASEEESHLFAHYLDCEAHHDILVEHFKTAHQKKINHK